MSELDKNQKDTSTDAQQPQPDQATTERDSVYQNAREARERLSAIRPDEGDYVAEQKNSASANIVPGVHLEQSTANIQTNEQADTQVNAPRDVRIGTQRSKLSGKQRSAESDQQSNKLEKENSLSETVSLNTEPYDGPSKLDSLDTL
jgi:hypothetical protein